MSTLAIMLTRRCNMACAHCSVESGPKAGAKGPSLEQLLDAVREAATAGVQSIIVTGGEPMLRERVALEMVRECCRLGVSSRVVTNGFWGRTQDRAERTLDAFLDAGLTFMTVSYDRFHAAFQGPEPVVHIARAAERRGFRVDVNVTRMANDGEIEDLVAPFADFPGIRFRYYDVQPVGNARDLPGAEMRAEVEGFCSACGIPALTDDGRLTACNGPSYFQPAGSPLVVGSLVHSTLGELLRRHAEDPVLDTIRTSGPAGLRDALLRTPGFDSFPFRDQYSGICDLCHHVTSSPEAVAALRTSLATPDQAAARVARSVLIDEQHDGGLLSRTYTNTAGAAKTFLAIAAGGAISAEESGRVLGRADFDWHAQAGALAAAGLAGRVLVRVEEPALARWAPQLFASRLRRTAVADAAREMAVEGAIRRLAADLAGRGGSVTAIGGAACALLAGGTGAATRSPAVFEVVVPGRHRLRGLPASVAIRSSIGHGPWRLPDSMLEGARAVPGIDGLRYLEPSAALVSAMVAAAARGLRGGLAAAWDARIALDAGIDVDGVLAHASAMRAPRAFWVPLRALARQVGLPVPDRLLSRAPDDPRQRRLEGLAAARLFAYGPGSPVADKLFGWAWPALATDTRAGFGRQLPATAARTARELPRAWREVGVGGMPGAFREARRIVESWTSGPH